MCIVLHTASVQSGSVIRSTSEDLIENSRDLTMVHMVHVAASSTTAPGILWCLA